MGEISLWLIIQDNNSLGGDCYPGGLHLQHLSGLEGHFVRASCPLWKRRIPILSGETAITEAFSSSISRGERGHFVLASCPVWNRSEPCYLTSVTRKTAT
jgi:hypothetical protein